MLERSRKVRNIRGMRVIAAGAIEGEFWRLPAASAKNLRVEGLWVALDGNSCGWLKKPGDWRMADE